MPHPRLRLVAAAFLLLGGVVLPLRAQDATIRVRQAEGSAHGFLDLATAQGTSLGQSELVQTVAGDTVRSTLTLRFLDGSAMTETVHYTQRGAFRMIDYSLVQHGPAFDHDLEAHLRRDGVTVVTATSHEDGSVEQHQDTLDLPSDVANGLPLVLVKNVGGNEPVTVHVVAFTPKPMLIGLEIVPSGSGMVLLGTDTIPTRHFVLKPKLGFFKGLAASILGKKPPDSEVWTTAGTAPAFLRFQGPLYLGAVWRLSLTSPTWP